eukprot:15336717-Ditylum_brightwellii.AAC.1
MDITFFDITSCHDFNCSLSIIDAKSRQLWRFLPNTKRTLLHIIKYFPHALKKEVKNVIELIIEEDGTISRSAEFTSMIIDKLLGIKISTTGGYASWLNAKIEKLHKIIKNVTRSTLMDK